MNNIKYDDIFIWCTDTIIDEIIKYLTHEYILKIKWETSISENIWKYFTILKYGNIMRDIKSKGSYDKWKDYFQYLTNLDSQAKMYNFRLPSDDTSYSNFLEKKDTSISDEAFNTLNEISECVNNANIGDILTINNEVYFVDNVNGKNEIIVGEQDTWYLSQPSNFNILIDYPLMYWIPLINHNMRCSSRANTGNSFAKQGSLKINLTKFQTEEIHMIPPIKNSFTQISHCVILTYQNISYAFISLVFVHDEKHKLLLSNTNKRFIPLSDTEILRYCANLLFNFKIYNISTGRIFHLVGDF